MYASSSAAYNAMMACCPVNVRDAEQGAYSAHFALVPDTNKALLPAILLLF